MLIHFVCMGNVYRSRFAEAYARSLDTEHTFSSSGLIAGPKQPYGPITWWGARLAFNYGVANHLTSTWQRTTQNLINDSDLVVFVNQEVFELAGQNFNLDNTQYTVWDVDDLYGASDLTNEELVSKLDESDVMGRYVTAQIDELMKSL